MFVAGVTTMANTGAAHPVGARWPAHRHTPLPVTLCLRAGPPQCLADFFFGFTGCDA